MNSELNFRFYSILKNEDAHPYIGKNFLVAADGMGGAGSTVHEINRKKYVDLKKEFYSCAFNDFNLELVDEGFKEYVNILLEPMIDEKFDTSALWASRIVIARYVYALSYIDEFKNADLSNDEVRQRIVNYVRQGITNTAFHFELESGEYSALKVLPTTLCSIIYKDNGDTIDVETVWAGDSRCYALLPDEGLIPLSIDDEDNSGALTNYFFVGEREVVLHYKKTTLKKPCVLMTVSDGIFDPFAPNDHFGVEWAFLSNLQESNDINEYKNRLINLFDTIRQDDSTVAFVPFGFDTFDNFKDSFGERSRYICDMWKKYESSRNALSVLNQPEEELKGYIIQRTNAKFSSFFNLIIDEAMKGTEDIVITDELKNMILAVKEQAKSNSGEKAILAQEIAIEELIEKIKNQHDYICLDNVFTNEAFLNVNTKCDRVITAYNEYSLAFDNIYKAEADVEEKQKNCFELLEKLYEEINYYRDEYDSLRGSISEEDIEKRHELLKKHNVLCEYELQMLETTNGEKRDPFKENKNDLSTVSHYFKPDEKQFLNSFISLHFNQKPESELKSARIALKNARRDCERAERMFDLAVNSFLVYFKNTKNINIFTPEFRANNNLDLVLEEEISNGQIKIGFSSLYSQEQFVELIVNALVNNTDKTSLVDMYYNGTKLSSFRDYYRLKENPDLILNIQRFEEEFTSLNNKYEEYIK